jgi:segregation and condensation protein B
MLRQLLERGLVKIAGRSPELGRPFLYATTKEFLTCFGFNTIKNIPRAKQLAGKGLPEWASSSDNFTDNPQSTSSVEESSDV